MNTNEYDKTPVGVVPDNREDLILVAMIRGTGSVDRKTLAEMIKTCSGQRPTREEVLAVEKELTTGYGFRKYGDGLRYSPQRKNFWDY